MQAEFPLFYICIAIGRENKKMGDNCHRANYVQTLVRLDSHFSLVSSYGPFFFFFFSQKWLAAPSGVTPMCTGTCILHQKRGVYKNSSPIDCALSIDLFSLSLSLIAFHSVGLLQSLANVMEIRRIHIEKKRIYIYTSFFHLFPLLLFAVRWRSLGLQSMW